MGFGTALPGSVPALLQDLLPIMHSSTKDGHCAEHICYGRIQDVVMCDIGAGCGNVLSDVEDSQVLGEQVEGSRPRLWGVEMNLTFCRSRNIT